MEVELQDQAVEGEAPYTPAKAQGKISAGAISSSRRSDLPDFTDTFHTILQQSILTGH